MFGWKIDLETTDQTKLFRQRENIKPVKNNKVIDSEFLGLNVLKKKNLAYLAEDSFNNR